MADPHSTAGGRTFGLIVNPTKAGAVELAASLCRRFAAHGWSALADPPTGALIPGTASAACPELGRRSEIVVVLGGDGTILKTAHLLEEHIKPLAAVNTGQLGFLTTAAAHDEERFVDAIVTGNYTLSRRHLMSVTFKRRDGSTCVTTALNEVSLTRGSPRMVHIQARIDGERFNHYSGDGLIVATPTGSTAYSLSAGGPIVSPEAAVFLVTPVCSHALANRSLVVNDRVTLEFIAQPGTEDLVLTVDGDGAEFPDLGTPVTIRRAPMDVPLVMLPGHSFFSLLQSKLGWKGTSLT